MEKEKMENGNSQEPENLATRYRVSLKAMERVRRTTPGGSQTLSKRPESFVEGAFPVLAKEGEGAYLIDIDGRRYLDFICGLGCMTLGYSHEYVGSLIQAQVRNGISFSLPSWWESLVAERLVEKIPCAEQIRFVKTGSEACAGAARIARMATGREVMIFIGYHGWHDGYVSSLPVHPGVPEVYSTVNIKCPYNDLTILQYLLEESPNQVAGIMLEPTLVEAPNPGYLVKVKQLAQAHGAVLIFDEVVMSGRWALAGGQEYFGVEPDMAVYGKFLGNGMPLGCIAGPEHLMRHAWAISGTFGGEVLSLAACDAVLDVYEKRPIIKWQWDLGSRLFDGLRPLCANASVPIILEGYAVHPRLRFPDDPDRWQMSVLLQELAARGVLIHQGGFNISAAMTEGDIDFAIQVFSEVLGQPFDRAQLKGKPYRDAMRTLPK